MKQIKNQDQNVFLTDIERKNDQLEEIDLISNINDTKNVINESCITFQQIINNKIHQQYTRNFIRPSANRSMTSSQLRCFVNENKNINILNQKNSLKTNQINRQKSFNQYKVQQYENRVSGIVFQKIRKYKVQQNKQQQELSFEIKKLEYNKNNVKMPTQIKQLQDIQFLNHQYNKQNGYGLQPSIVQSIQNTIMSQIEQSDSENTKNKQKKQI